MSADRILSGTDAAAVRDLERQVLDVLVAHSADDPHAAVAALYGALVRVIGGSAASAASAVGLADTIADDLGDAVREEWQSSNAAPN